MNDQIKKLSRQVPGWNCNGVYLGPYDKSLEKFAELLIRDLVDTIKRTQPVGPDFEWSILNNYNLEIKDE